jgi:methionyl aminopeptidase
MAITIKSAREIELMKEAGRILEIVHNELGKALHPGMSTLDIDRLGEEIIRSYGCIPSFLDYRGYPASICVSVNEEVVHGIPDKHRILKDGDIVSLDAGVIYKGYHSDAARTHGIGVISKEAEELIRVTRECFFEGIKYAKEGNYLFDISAAIDSHAVSHGFGVVRDLCGHGIGTALHEAPEIPNYKMNRRGVKLKAGMTLAIEPMINRGTWEVDWLDDEWTVVTRDRSLSAHYENTVLITKDEPVLLTLSQES